MPVVMVVGNVVAMALAMVVIIMVMVVKVVKVTAAAVNNERGRYVAERWRYKRLDLKHCQKNRAR
jgi:hypothetical protein